MLSAVGATLTSVGGRGAEAAIGSLRAWPRPAPAWYGAAPRPARAPTPRRRRRLSETAQEGVFAARTVAQRLGGDQQRYEDDDVGVDDPQQHRINRSSDRQLNRALPITLIRMRLDPATKTYIARSVAEGKTSRDAQRCLERAICRQLFKILERPDRNDGGSLEGLPEAA
ncbi:hypothetical protein [Streptomyces umbrinus]|uniref:hypothetical protein n=1 Tax=Streptomyces umbrinus TaxID=67370 RepID=UPI0035715EBC